MLAPCCNAPGMRTIAPRTVKDDLERHASAGPSKRAALEACLDSLRDGLTGPVTAYHLGPGRSPVYSLACDDQTLLIAFGVGSHGDEEARVLAIAPTDQAQARVVELAGVADETIVEVAALDDLPIRPSMRLKWNQTLADLDDLDAAIQDQAESSPDQLEGTWVLLRSVGYKRRSPIVLDPHQERTLLATRPLLLQGIAGSGKTTMLATLAWRKTTERSSVLVVAYTNELRAYIEGSLARLFEQPELPPGLTVLTWRDLCDGLARDAGLPEFPWLEDIEGINESIQQRCTELRLTPNLEVGEVQAEIRAVLKGNMIELDSELLPEETYLAQSTKLDRAAGERHRPAIYQVATAYQAKLKARGEVDELDVARTLLQLDPGRLPRWDYVLIDEVQDYTRLQLRLLATLARRPQGLVFAGDINQVVYPSAFRWNRVSEALKLETLLPSDGVSLTTLQRNFRCPEGVFNLAVGVLTARARALGLDAPEEADGWGHPVLGHKPRLLTVREKNVPALLQRLAESIGSLGVISPLDAPRLPWSRGDRVRFRRSFLPQSCKGLEFDVVVLNGFDRHYGPLLQGLGGTKATRGSRLLELFTAITRTRQRLILLETSDHQGLWNAPELSSLIDPIASVEGLLADLTDFKIDGPDGWAAAAHEFQDQDAWASAAECWERAGEPRRAALALRRAAETSNEPTPLLLDAARLLVAAGDLELAANTYERAEDFLRAAEVWERCALPEDAARCYERGSRFRDAARVLRSVDPVRAAKLFERAQEFRDAATCLASCGRHGDAALLMERVAEAHPGDRSIWLDAGRMWAEAGVWPAAEEVLTQQVPDIRRLYYRTLAKRHQDLGQSGRVLHCWEHGEHWERLAEHHGSADRHELAGSYYARAGRHEDAAESYQAAGLPARAREQWTTAGVKARDKGDHVMALKYFDAAGQRAEVAQCYEALGHMEEAIKAWTSAGRHHEAEALKAQKLAGESPNRRNEHLRKAAERWRQGKRHARAGALFAELEAHAEAARSFDAAGEWGRAASHWIRAAEALESDLASGWDQRAAAAKCLWKARDYEAALEQYTLLDADEEVAGCLLELGRWNGAVDLYQTLQNWPKLFDASLRGLTNSLESEEEPDDFRLRIGLLRALRGAGLARVLLAPPRLSTSSFLRWCSGMVREREVNTPEWTPRGRASKERTSLPPTWWDRIEALSRAAGDQLGVALVHLNRGANKKALRALRDAAPAEAARLLDDAGLRDEALAFWRAAVSAARGAGDDTTTEEALERLGRWTDLGRHHEETGHLRGAVWAYNEAGRVSDVQRCKEALRREEEAEASRDERGYGYGRGAGLSDIPGLDWADFESPDEEE